MKYVYYLILAILILGITSIGNTETITLNPTNNMYTDVEHIDPHPPGELWVAEYDPAGQYQRIMISFDLSEYEGQTVESAYLHLNRFFGCPSGGITATKFYAITENWNETTWQNNIHIQYDAYVWASYNFGADGWHSIDITGLVNDWLNNKIVNNGLLMRAESGSKWSKFYSKDDANPDVHPYLEFETTGTGIETEDKTIIINKIFHNNYPNPFNPETYIQFNIPDDESNQSIQLKIYNTKGEIVRTLLNKPLNSGLHTILWNGKDNNNKTVSSGIYFYNLIIGEKNFSKKMIMIK